MERFVGCFELFFDGNCSFCFCFFLLCCPHFGGYISALEYVCLCLMRCALYELWCPFLSPWLSAGKCDS